MEILDAVINIVSHPLVGVYAYGILFVWLINAVLAGYNGITPNKDDFWQSVLWPISIAVLLGIIIRLIVEKMKERKKKPKQKGK